LGTGINPPLIPKNSKKRPSCKRSDDIVGGLAEKGVLLYYGECVYNGGVTLDIVPHGNETPCILGDGVGGLAEMGVVVCLSECV